MSTEPIAGAAPIIATCPRCSAQLKLLRTPIEFTPIKCYKCQALFCLEAIETAPVETASSPATTLPPLTMSGAPLPGSRDASVTSSLRPMTLPAAAPAILPTMTPPGPPPAPAVLPNMTPSFVPPPPAPVIGQTPAQAAPSTGPKAAPAPSTPMSKSNQPRMILDLGPTESIIAIAVTVVVVLVLITGGVYAYRTLIRSPGEPANATADAARPGVSAEERPPLITHTGPVFRTPELPPESDSAKASLVGNWVSRADDGSSAKLNFQSDGSAIFTDSLSTEISAEPRQGRWAVIGVEGNVATVAIYYAEAGLNMHRMTIEIASPECINVIESAFRGKVQKWDQRFVREGAPPVKPNT